MASVRLDLRVPDSLLARVDEARGREPRASFVKRALEAALEVQGGPDSTDVARRPETAARPASPRASVPGVMTAGAMLRARRERAAQITGHHVGCKCLRCDEALRRPPAV